MMLNIYHHDDGKEKHQSHEILMDDIYIDFTHGDTGGQIDLSLMAWGETREESIKNFFIAKGKLIALLNEQIEVLKQLDNKEIYEKHPTYEKRN